MIFQVNSEETCSSVWLIRRKKLTSKYSVITEILTKTHDAISGNTRSV